jgi:cytochrome c oxidase subunit I+III
MTPRPAIDVSVLPAEVRDSRSPAWWGNVLFMAIETTTVALLIGSYLYLWRNNTQGQWPPPRTDTLSPMFEAKPDLLFGTLNALLLLASVPLMRWVSEQCARQFDRLEQLQKDKPSEADAANRPEPRPIGVLLGLAGLLAIGIVALVLRWYEFPGLHVKWNENAYASIVWTLLGLHFVYILIEAVEFAVMIVWTWMFELGENQSTDVILTGEYWYWTVGIGVAIYVVVYWFPRIT